MKKNLWTLAAMLFMSVAFFSCGGDDEAGTGGGNDNTGEGGGSTTIPSGDVTPDKEKQYLEEVGREFVNLFKASDYQDIADLGNELGNIEGEGVFEDFIKETQNGAYDKTLLIAMANIKGTYSGSYAEGKMKKVSSNGDLNITYTASDKSQWVLQATGSGSWGVTTVSKDKDYHWDGNSSYYSTTTYKLDIPKSLNVKLTKNGASIANVNLNITNLTLDNENVVDLGSKMSYTLTAQVKDFDIKSNAEYNAGGNASVSASVNKGGKALVAVSVNGSTTMSKGEITNGKANVNVVILNKVNIKGEMKDAKSFGEALEKADSYSTDAANFDRWIKNANSYIDFGLYNNTPTKQATLFLGKDSYRKYDYSTGKDVTHYRPAAMLKFADDTTYSLEEYFDERSFQSVTDAFNRVMREFERLVK